MRARRSHDEYDFDEYMRGNHVPVDAPPPTGRPVWAAVASACVWVGLFGWPPVPADWLVGRSVTQSAVFCSPPSPVPQPTRPVG